ncbi:MAG: leucyl aminopeptidase family protein [Myxococcales bacterium FL481]|nr:MAG: leucyl aminopeptidase family protein [Myxococcales bacterium FL481]
MATPKLIPVADPKSTASRNGPCDALILVGPADSFAEFEPAAAVAQAQLEADKQAAAEVSLVVAPELAGGRLVLAPTGPLARDYDDVRRFADAARLGIRRARDAGAKQPCLALTGVPAHRGYAHATEVALLGALDGLWEPLEARQHRGDTVSEPIATLTFASAEPDIGQQIATLVDAIETGRRLARDLGGTEPERMRPEGFAAYCKEAFAETSVRVDVVDDPDTLLDQYPLLSAVGRASMVVPRHRPCVIRLVYDGGQARRTLLLAGKGVTYDTGGADLKVNGSMAGMSRDKGGAAAVAGFVRTVAKLAPTDLKVVAEIGAVRNSVGADSFVSDEIIVSHAQTRVRIGNTDAEGRLVLADLLSHLREHAVQAPSPQVMSVATLTGHSMRAVGQYSIALENGPARQVGIANRLSQVGDEWGDPFEISRLRREDFAFVQPRSTADDVLSCNNAPSTGTNRGHQFPMAFLAIASGLDKHGRDAATPIPYTHIDIGGSATHGSDWQHGRPTGAPVCTLAAAYLRDE